MNIFIQSPLDMHLHLREADMLKLVAPLSASHFAGAVIMPNLLDPVDSLDKLLTYRDQIIHAIGSETFTPYMTLFFREYSEYELETAKEHIIGIKLYPAGITTNSESGISSLDQGRSTFEFMQELQIPLLVHGETNGFVLDRESEFLGTYAWLAENFPDLKIIMEHITTRDAVELLDQYENLFATVTLQHLIITLDDIAGGLLSPHLFCKPIAKFPHDREALLQAALIAHPKLMFGSDSAPHPLHKKECAGCAAGVFTAPVALAVLAELFEKHNALDKLQGFVSDNAQKIYNISPFPKSIEIEKSDFIIPNNYGNVVPFMAGKTISWTVKEF